MAIKPRHSAVDPDYIVFDFSFPTSIAAGKCNNFTNLFSDEMHFRKEHKKLFRESLSTFDKQRASDIRKANHCHRLSGKNEDFVKSILYELVILNKIRPDEKTANDFVTQNLEGQMLYQLGINQAMRIIGFFDRGHHFKVLFIDYHHLVYPDKKKYNRECETWNFNPF